MKKDFLLNDENLVDVSTHYDLLIDENNDPVLDGLELKDYMDKFDGNLFLKELALTGNESVLEIGVGTGRLAARICDKCKYFKGIDLSKKTVERAKKHFKQLTNTNIILGDFLKYCFDEQFDLIYSSLTFFHIKEKDIAFSKVNKLLVNGGRFVLSISKNQDRILNYGSRKLELFPDVLPNTIELLKNQSLSINKIVETENAYIIKTIK